MPGPFLRATALCLALVVTGCSRQADYPVALMVADDALVGVWSLDGNQDNARIEIRHRDVGVIDGRTRGAVNASSDSPPKQTTAAYTLLIQSDDLPQPIELSAVLLEVDGVRLMGFQLSDEELDRNPISGLTLPLSYLARIERDGDDVRAWLPSVSLAWVPAAQWLDPPQDPPVEIARDAGKGLRLTSSMNRLIDVYRTEMNKPGFWSDDPAVFSRVK